MDTVLNYLRQILGEANFYIQGTGSYSGTWDYAAMIEYVVAALIVLVVISNVFRFLRLLVK